LSIKSVY